jgi:hypothetical protein
MTKKMGPIFLYNLLAPDLLLIYPDLPGLKSQPDTMHLKS